MRNILIVLTMLFLTGVAPLNATPDLHSEYVTYERDGVTMEGYLVWDNSFERIRPGVLVVHEWDGIGDYEISRANQLAELGYVAFAADVYGIDVRPTTFEENMAASSAMMSDRNVLRARLSEALNILKACPVTDPQRVAAIGYCFGGSSVIEIARAGIDVNGIVSFHGAPATDGEKGLALFDGKILVCHGGDDPHVSMESVNNFIEECRAGGVDWQVNMYGGAVHGFTNPENGDDVSRGVAYNADADRRSWEAMLDFFDEIFE